MSRLAGLLLASLAVACTPAPAQEPASGSFTPPHWSALDRSDLPPRLASAYVRNAVGWDGGLLVTAGYPEPVLFASPDGRQWTEQVPEGFADYVVGQSLAAYGPTAYVLAGGPDGVVVWRTDDGATWDRAVLPDTGPGEEKDPRETSPGETSPGEDLEETNTGETFLAIAAGPRGVVVVVPDGFDYDAGMEAPHTPDDPYGFDVWHSPDGRSFRHTGSIALTRHVGGPVPRVVATDDGFLLHDGDIGDAYRDDTPLYRSTDGADWEDIGDGLPIGSRVAAGRTGDLTFVLGRDPDGLYARYRRDGDQGWHVGATDLGRMPDAGVVARDQQWMTAVHPRGTGFIAIGRTEDGDGGLVWTSPDGVEWTRMPVRDNGFDRLAETLAVASSRGVTYLFGTADFPPTQELLVWRADDP